jgi:DNA polymerase-1
MKMLLIDGPAVAYRSHFALGKSNLTAPDGKSTAATYGYTTTLLKLLRDEKPDYVCVAFDTEEPTYRHDLFEDYKADRPPMPDELADQIDWIRTITEAMGITILELDGYEADDIIGTLAAEATGLGIDSVIATGDKDMLQLVNPHTKVIMLSGWGRDTKVMDEKAVRAKYGIGPELLRDYFGLMGDAIDNVPGVHGIGEKTAGALVREYGSLETIYEKLEEVKSKRVHSVLSAGREQAFSSRELVTVNKEVPLAARVTDLARRDIEQERLGELFQRLGFRSLKRQICGGEKAVSVEPVIWQEGAPDRKLACDGRLGIYVNFGGPIAACAPILGVAVSCEGTGDFYFPINHQEPGNVSVNDLRQAASHLLGDVKIKKVVHDAKKVILAMERMEIGIEGIEFDTLLAGYLLNPGQGGLEVEALATDYLGLSLGGEQGGRSRKPLVTRKDASQRCCARAHVLLRLSQVMEEELSRRGLMKLFRDMELPLARVLARMEASGVTIDRGRLEDLSVDLDKRLAMIETDAYALAGRRFNLNSPRDVSYLLFEEIGLKPRRKTKTGYSTDISVLTELSAEHELPKKILEHRQLAKLKTTYVDQLLRYADPVTGKIHANFNQTVTATGRLSSSDPNLQNIPIRTEIGSEIRKAFIPSRPGWVLISADYSQIELRILAHLSGDENLTEAFKRGEDIHARTAAFIFKVAPDRVSVGMRSIAKSVNFGIVYGMGAQGLARAAGLSIAEAEKFLAEHRATYPGVYSYIDKSLEAARKDGYVETLLGRKRFLPNLNSTEGSLRSASERMAVNTPIQGSAADIIKIAMLGLDAAIEDRQLEGGILIQVHDDILVECPEAQREAIEAMVRDKMSSAYPLAVPLKVEVNSGSNWYEAH